MRRAYAFGSLQHRSSCWSSPILDSRLQELSVISQQDGRARCASVALHGAIFQTLLLRFPVFSPVQEATLRGETDALATPASRIVMGRSVELGTGCLDLTQRLDSLGLGC